MMFVAETEETAGGVLRPIAIALPWQALLRSAL